MPITFRKTAVAKIYIKQSPRFFLGSNMKKKRYGASDRYTTYINHHIIINYKYHFQLF